MTDIKVYSTPTCPWCTKLKAYLDEKGVAYEDVDVSADQEAARKMIERSGQMGVPQTEINGKMIVGFDKDTIDREIAKLKAD